MEGLRIGVLLGRGSCRSGVRTKAGINMDTAEDSVVSRLPNEGCIGPGATASIQKPSCRSVVG